MQVSSDRVSPNDKACAGVLSSTYNIKNMQTNRLTVQGQNNKQLYWVATKTIHSNNTSTQT